MVKPGFLGTKESFEGLYNNPIMNGIFNQSRGRYVDKSKKRIYALHDSLKCCVHRRDQRVLRYHLPDKHDYVLKIRLSEKQIKIYEEYLDYIQDEIASRKSRILDDEEDTSLFRHSTFFSQLTAHPWIIRNEAKDKVEVERRKNMIKVLTFIYCEVIFKIILKRDDYYRNTAVI